MESTPDPMTEQQAAWRLQFAVYQVLCGIGNGIVDTMVTDDAAGMGDLDGAEMALTEATPVLVARHAVLLSGLRAGLRDARVQRSKAAWDRLVPTLNTLARLSGAELPPIPAAAPYPPNIRFRSVVAPEPLTSKPIDGPVVFLAGGITDCPDWQATATNALAHDHVVLLNPRRLTFDLDDPHAADLQVLVRAVGRVPLFESVMAAAVRKRSRRRRRSLASHS